MAYGGEISKITIPDGSGGTLTYDIKDATARAAIAAGFTFHIAKDAGTTPLGVQWWDDDQGEIITGTLVASASTTGFYLVPATYSQSGEPYDSYDEYVTVITGGSGTELDPYTYAWEKLGNTEIDFDELGDLAWEDTATGSTTIKTADSATFSNGSASVSATYTPAGSIDVTLTQTSTAATLTKGDYTPAGSVSKPTITVTPSDTKVQSKKTDGSVSAGSAASFTRGSFSGGSFTQGTDQFVAPVLTTSVSNEVLTISFTSGSFTQGSDSFTAATHGADTFVANTPTSVTLPTFEEKTVLTGASAALDSAPTFTGTKATDALVTAVNYDKASVNTHTFTGTQATIASSGTATGDVTLTKTDKTVTITVS